MDPRLTDLLSNPLDLLKVSDGGYYLRGGKKAWLKDSQGLLEVLKHIGSKREDPFGVWWRRQVKKTVMASLEQRRSVMVRKGGRKLTKKRYKALKKQHGNKYSAPQHQFWAEALEVGLHSNVEDPPCGHMFEGSATKGSKKPDESKEVITDLAKVITGVIQKDHKTPQLRRNPIKQADTPPNVSRLLEAAELKPKYVQQVKDLHALYEVGAISQEDYEQQKRLIIEQITSF